MKKTATKILLLLAYTFINLSLFGQGPTCADADPFCSDDPTYTFPAGVGSGSFGSRIGCLGSTPNPAWYFLQVDQPGRINIYMWTTPSKDLDFICWGPFTSSSYDALVASGVCSQLNTSGGSSHGPSYGANPSSLGGYPIGNIIDCSYSGATEEYVHIPNAVPGNWYILLITNYSNRACQINFQSHATSSGSTNCAIVRPFQGDTVCAGETATLTVENPPADAYFTFEGPNGFFQSSTSPVALIPNAQASNAGTYTLVITPNVGSPGPPTEAIVVVHPKPEITITASDICSGASTPITATGASTYVWSSGQTGASFTVSPTTTTTYTVTGTSVRGCVDTASITVSVHNNPTLTITPSAICSGEEAVVSSPTGVTFLWSDDLGDSTVVSPIVTEPKTYTVTVTDNNNCTETSTLTVNPDAVIEAFGDEICIGEQAEIRASGGDSYIWSNGMQGETIGVNPTFTMIYSVTGTNQFGCKGEDTTMVIVHPKPEITITASDICSGEEAVVSSPTGVTFLWSDDLGDSTVVSPIVTEPKTYTVTVTDNNNCTETSTLTVNPDAVIEAFGDEICIGEQAEIRASGGQIYVWNNGMQGETIQVSPNFTTDFTVTGTNQYGCKGEDMATVTVHPKPNANFSTATNLVSLDNPYLDFIDESTDADFWFWNFGNFASQSNTSILQNPTHTYTSVGHFTTWLVVTTEFGCTDSVHKVIQVKSPFSFYIPNAFTPDKDGLNETFRPYGRGLDPSEYTMMIFDRWGTLIYKSNIPFASWDGYINGQRAPQGLYAYRFFIKDLEGRRREYSGHFTILR